MSLARWEGSILWRQQVEGGLYVFYNVIDLAIINSWLLYKKNMQIED